MKSLLVLFLVLLPVTGFAETQNETIFSILQSWYENGRNVKWNEIKGSYSGRCYFMNKPDQPYPSILTYAPSLDDNGPGFDPVLPLMVEIVQWSDSSKTFQDYDNISADEVKDFQKYIRTYLAKYSAGLVEDPTVTQKYDLEPNNRPDFLQEYRVYDSYIVHRATNLIGQNLGLPSGNVFVKENQVFSMCYFFTQVGG